MIENNLVTVIGDKVLDYPNEIGIRHLDKLKEACRELNLEIDKNNELEVAMFLASNNYMVVMNSYGALPIIVSDFQLEFLMNAKEKLYKIEEQGTIIEIVITTERIQDYNRKNYRNLGTEKQIASYEGKKITSQLDILYEELENQKKNKR